MWMSFFLVWVFHGMPEIVNPAEIARGWVPLSEPYRSIDMRNSSMECFFQVLITLAGALCFTLLLGARGGRPFRTDGTGRHERSKVEMLHLEYWRHSQLFAKLLGALNHLEPVLKWHVIPCLLVVENQSCSSCVVSKSRYEPPLAPPCNTDKSYTIPIWMFFLEIIWIYTVFFGF